ncbi:MAG: V-type ATP synthase subunit I [Rikenellaceae bacterium]
MSKYNILLFAGECAPFVERLRDLGLVEITTTGFEPSDEDHNLLLEIEATKRGIESLKEFASSEKMDSTAEAYGCGKEAIEAYTAIVLRSAAQRSDMEQMEKCVEEMRPWGEFSVSDLEALAKSGLTIRYFTTQSHTFETQMDAWGEKHNIELINNAGGFAYFVLIQAGGESTEVDIDAQEIKAPTITSKMAGERLEQIKVEAEKLSGEISRCAASMDRIEEYSSELNAKLQGIKVKATAESAADGSLLLMEGWAESESAARVDALLEEQPNVVYIKSDPTPEDNTPIKLKNGWYSSLFEMIGNLYALPKYGTIDLTPFFAPFYMLFFAICLCDAGYGLMITLAGLALYKKGGEKLRPASWLTILCGSTAVVFGFLANSFFGMEISSLPLFANFKFIDFQLQFFSASMAIGMIQILFGMMINIYVSTKAFGLRAALGTIGWFLLVFSGALSYALTVMGVAGFGFDSVPFYAMISVALVLMFFFNSPDKNIFANFGIGLWQTYDHITGFLSDILSYIRLFAIGLSGGVLALVFNQLAVGITGLDQGIEGQPIYVVIIQVIFASLILLLGHSINLFMSTITSFVHPMRLTFVEFYKNAGFEMGTRKFDPLKK